MSKQPLLEQRAIHSYNTQPGTPKRSSATADDLHERQTAARVHTQTRATSEDTEAPGSIGIINKSLLRHRPITTLYLIPLTDGTEMRVTERELGDLPEDYQNAARLVTPQLSAPRPRRKPNPKLPVQDTTVYEMPAARTHARGTDALPKQKRRHLPRFHWLFWVGLALVTMVAGYILLNSVGNWWNVTQDDWHYGRPRTYQTDWNVGHGTPTNPNSHFIALNLNKHIEVIEIQGDDPAHTKMYVGPTLIGVGEEFAPVTLSFGDVNHDGKPDLLLHVGDSQSIFLNTVPVFKPAPNQ